MERIKTEWSPQFSYAIGLLATDGNLSPDGRHIDLTSKDEEQLTNFMKCVGVEAKIGYKTSGFSGKKVPRIQIGDVNFYRFLLGIGLMPNKSKTLSKLLIPDKYFLDFLRGHFDGDGTFYSYWDSRWKNSFMCYTVFLSASKAHIIWLQERLFDILGIKGHVVKSINNPVYNLRYAKQDSLKLLPKLYYDSAISLSRKRLKVERALQLTKV